MPILEQAKKNYEIGKIIVVADKGINTADNIAFCLAKRDGYIYSQTVRGGNKELKAFVLDPSGYRQFGDGYKIKSRLYPREIAVSNAEGGRTKIRIDEKQVVFYSPDYDRRVKADREPALLKARDLRRKKGLMVTTPLLPANGENPMRRSLKFTSGSGVLRSKTCKYKLSSKRVRVEIFFLGCYHMGALGRLETGAKMGIECPSTVKAYHP